MRLTVDLQGVIELRAVVDRDLAINLIDVLEIPPKRSQRRLDQERLGIGLVS